MGAQIGQLNGPWSILLRIFLVTVGPLAAGMLACLAWLVVNQVLDNQFRTNSTIPITSTDLRLLAEQIKSDFPPDEWKARVIAMEVELKAINLNQVRILTLLDSKGDA
jgi:hypothetical protein